MVEMNVEDTGRQIKRAKRGIRKHIESFPTVESHYIRKSTNRQYLATDLNIKRMYEAYACKCKEAGTEAVNEPIYRRIFNEEYNMSFHVPKKDQCTLCNKYHSAKSDGTLDEKTEEDIHHTNLENQLHESRNIMTVTVLDRTVKFILALSIYNQCCTRHAHWLV